MSVSKADITEKIATQTDLPKNSCQELVEHLLEIVKSQLEAGEDVLVSGFGKFQVKEKKPRKGRNPATGESMMLPGRKVVTFKCSGKLKDRINGNHQT